MMASTFNSRAISGRLLLARLYCMTEVPEMTRSDPILARSVINWSVMPSTKNSSDGSPDTFLRGRTAIEPVGATPALACSHIDMATSPSAKRAQRTRTRLLFHLGGAMGDTG